MPLANSYNVDDVDDVDVDTDDGGANAVTGVIMAAMRVVATDAISLVMVNEFLSFSGRQGVFEVGSSSTRQMPRPNTNFTKPPLSSHSHSP